MSERYEVDRLLVEYNPSGHHFFHIRVLLEGARRRGYTLRLATSRRALESQEWKVHLTGLLDETEVLVSEHERLTVDELARLVHEVEPDLTVVPDGDLIALRVTRLRKLAGRRVRLQILRYKAQFPKAEVLSPVKAVLKRAVIDIADRVPGVETVTMLPVTFSARGRRRYAIDPVTFTVDDVAVERARERLGGEPSVEHWVAILGAIARRKNVPLVARAIASLPEGRIGLLVAGKVLDESIDEIAQTERLMHEAGHRMVVDDRSLSDAELDAYVEIADCIAIAHSNDGPSGLLAKGLIAGTSVVAAGAPALRVAARGQPGAEWVPLEADALAGALSRAVSRKPAPAEGLGSEHWVEALLD